MITQVIITNIHTGRKEICIRDDVIGKRTFWSVLVVAPDGTSSRPNSRTDKLMSNFITECGKVMELEVELS